MSGLLHVDARERDTHGATGAFVRPPAAN